MHATSLISLMEQTHPLLGNPLIGYPMLLLIVANAVLVGYRIVNMVLDGADSMIEQQPAKPVAWQPPVLPATKMPVIELEDVGPARGRFGRAPQDTRP